MVQMSRSQITFQKMQFSGGNIPIDGLPLKTRPIYLNNLLHFIFRGHPSCKWAGAFLHCVYNTKVNVHHSLSQSSAFSMYLTGFPRSWKVLDFFGYNFQVLESPWKWVWKVLEIWVQGPGKSWNFLGYDNDMEGGQNDAGADAEICVFAHLYRLFH